MRRFEKKMINSALFAELQTDYRKKLQKKYGFESWHLLPMYEKKYLHEIYQTTQKELMFETGGQW